jgi:hypothetical protein
MSIRHLVYATSIVTTVGCRTPAMRDPDVQITARRLVAVPTAGMVFQFGNDGRETVQEDQSALASKNLDNWINYRLSLHGGRFFDANAVAPLEHAPEFRRWGVETLTQIMVERLGNSPTKHRSVSDWRFIPSIASWRAALRADFVLVSLYIHGRDETAANALLARVSAARRAIVCAVQLDDGRIVWCNFIEMHHWNIDMPAGARALAEALLDGMPLR